MFQVVDMNAGVGALCFKWRGHNASSGRHEGGSWGIMLQVMATNLGGGASCFRGGACCFKW